MRIEADKVLNGKIVLKVEELSSSSAMDVYLMPSYVDPASKTHGLIENKNYKWNLQVGSQIEAPSDWQMIVNFYRLNGTYKIKSWVQELQPADVNLLRNAW